MTFKPALLCSALLFAASVHLPLYADEITQATPALWIVSDEDTTISILGTMHMMRPGVQWFTGEVRSAYEAADEIVVETIPPAVEEQQAIIVDMAVDKSGQSLRSKLSVADRIQFENALFGLGIPSSSFDALEPWMAFMTISLIPMMQAGYSPEIGVESILTQAATADEKPMIGLEGFEEQLGFLDSLDEQLQITILNSTVQQIHSIRTMMRSLEELWATGRIDELGEAMQESMHGYAESEEFTNAILYKRNHAWARWVNERMKQSGNVLMAVGAGHLTGDQSLLQLLSNEGFAVRRVNAVSASND